MSKYKEYAEKATEFLALTGYTRQEFDALLPHFRRCYYDRMKTYRLDGKPRGKQRPSDYKNSSLPATEDKLFFILNYLKTNNLQSVQGVVFGIGQCLDTLVTSGFEAGFGRIRRTTCPSHGGNDFC